MFCISGGRCFGKFLVSEFILAESGALYITYQLRDDAYFFGDTVDTGSVLDEVRISYILLKLFIVMFCKIIVR